jgi:hypothetical protein
MIPSGGGRRKRRFHHCCFKKKFSIGGRIPNRALRTSWQYSTARWLVEHVSIPTVSGAAAASFPKKIPV